MGLFYLDTELTNGNYYLGDIFEIAVLSEDRNQIFHSYINTRRPISRYVLNMCNVTLERIKQSPPFHEVMESFFSFIKREEAASNTTTSTIIIAHAGFYFDFPLLFVNCMRRQNGRNFLAEMKNFKFVDSVQALQYGYGYKKTSLSFLTGEKERVHSAIKDVELLRGVVKNYRIDKNFNLSPLFSMQDIIQYLNSKLPISIDELRKLACTTSTRESFEIILYEHAITKSALSKKQVCNIANIYFLS